MPGGTDRVHRPRLYEQRIGDGEVVEERFVGPLAGPLSRPAIRLVGWRSEAGGRGGDTQVIEASSRAQPSGSAG